MAASDASMAPQRPSAPAVDVLSSGDDDRTLRPRRRWLWVLLVVAVVVAGAWQPVVRQLRHDEARWLANKWALRAAWDDARTRALSYVTGLARDTDGTLVARAVVAVDAEEAARLGEVRRSTAGRTLTSATDRQVRRAVLAGLDGEIADLRAAARAAPAHPSATFPPAVAASAVAVAAAERQVMQLRDQLDLSAAKAAVPPLTAAEPVLAALTRPFETTTGGAVLAVAPETARLVDIDTGGVSTVLDTAAVGLTEGGLFLATADERDITFGLGAHTLLVHLADRAVRTVPGTPISPVRDGVWTATGSAIGDDTTYRLIDRTGRTVLGPVHDPAGAVVRGAVDTFLLLSYPKPTQPLDAEDLWLWQPGHAARRFPIPRAVPIGSLGTAVAWHRWGDGRTLYLTDIASGTSLTLGTLPLGETADIAVFSPDGRHLALVSFRYSHDGPWSWWLTTSDSRRLHAALPGISTTPIGWSRDGRWLLLATSASGNAGADTPDELWLCDTDTDTTKPLRLQLAPGEHAAALLGEGATR